MLELSGSGAVIGDDLPGRTVIGCNNIIGHYAVVGVKCQDMKYKVSLKIKKLMRVVKWQSLFFCDLKEIFLFAVVEIYIQSCVTLTKSSRLMSRLSLRESVNSQYQNFDHMADDHWLALVSIICISSFRFIIINNMAYTVHMFSQTGDECYLDIGDNNEIREHSSIHRSSKSSDRTVGLWFYFQLAGYEPSCQFIPFMMFLFWPASVSRWLATTTLSWDLVTLHTIVRLETVTSLQIILF